MPTFLLNMLLTATVVSFASWLSGTRPGLAGFIIAMPIATLLVLPMSHQQYADPATSVNFAKSIFFAIHMSLLFFVPFLCAEKFNFGFWTCYILGILLLVVGYFLHKKITGMI